MIGLTQAPVQGIRVGGEALRVNRAVVQMGEEKQLTYYWFMQGGRVVTSEGLIRWYIFWDALTRNRSDGALVRLMTPMAPGENEQNADTRLAEFSREAVKYLPAYVPN